MPKQISTPLFLRAKKGSVLFAEESTNLFVFALDQKYLRDFYNFDYPTNFISERKGMEELLLWASI